MLWNAIFGLKASIVDSKTNLKKRWNLDEYNDYKNQEWRSYAYS